MPPPRASCFCSPRAGRAARDGCPSTRATPSSPDPLKDMSEERLSLLDYFLILPLLKNFILVEDIKKVRLMFA